MTIRLIKYPHPVSDWLQLFQVLLRAYPEANSNAVVVETRLLSEHLPQEARRRLTDGEDPTAQLLYYQDSTTHGVQRAARRAWKVQSASSVKRSASSATITGGSTVKVAKKAKVSVESEVETVTKKKTVTVVSGTASLHLELVRKFH